MSKGLKDLPPDLKEKLLTFLREVDGEFEVADMKGLVGFIVENGTKYPALYGLLNINKEEVVDHSNRTGEVPPGIKLVRKTQESEKVTRLEVLHGPTPPKGK
jgi:hypothetical protein